MVCKLFAVIQRQAQSSLWRYSCKQLTDALRHFPCLFCARALDQCIPRVSLHQCHQIARCACSVDEVAFPMPHTSSLFYLGRSSINHTLIGDSSSPSSFLSRTTPPTLSLGSWEVVPKSPSDLCLRINVLIDRFLAHRLPPLQSRPLANYLRRPSFLQSQINILLHFWRKSSRSLSSSPCLRLLMCLLCSIAAPTFIALYLTANTARGSLQAPSHLPQALAHLTPIIYQSTFFFSHAFVGHFLLLVFVAPEELTLPRDFFLIHVLH